jgi:hypothetical protein
VRLRLYVEDRYFRSYEALARKWHSGIGAQPGVSHVEAVHLRLDRMGDRMYKQIARAKNDGFDCVVFVLDQESSPERHEFVRDLHSTFVEVCRELEGDRDLQHMKVGLVVAVSCLECWLLADAQAVVRFACRRGTRVNYSPRQRGNTELLGSKEACDEITHILREVARRRGQHKANRLRYEKSATPEMIEQMGELAQAAHRNHSLDYFFRRVTCQTSGCDSPQRGVSL